MLVSIISLTNNHFTDIKVFKLYVITWRLATLQYINRMKYKFSSTPFTILKSIESRTKYSSLARIFEIVAQKALFKMFRWKIILFKPFQISREEKLCCECSIYTSIKQHNGSQFGLGLSFASLYAEGYTLWLQLQS